MLNLVNKRLYSSYASSWRPVNFNRSHPQPHPHPQPQPAQTKCETKMCSKNVQQKKYIKRAFSAVFQHILMKVSTTMKGTGTNETLIRNLQKWSVAAILDFNNVFLQNSLYFGSRWPDFVHILPVAPGPMGARLRLRMRSQQISTWRPAAILDLTFPSQRENMNNF